MTGGVSTGDRATVINSVVRTEMEQDVRGYKCADVHVCVHVYIDGT